MRLTYNSIEIKKKIMKHNKKNLILKDEIEKKNTQNTILVNNIL